MFIVYTEIHKKDSQGNSSVERWYYGRYEHDKANEVVKQLGNSEMTFHCVCAEADAEILGIRNIPVYVE